MEALHLDDSGSMLTVVPVSEGFMGAQIGFSELVDIARNRAPFEPALDVKVQKFVSHLLLIVNSNDTHVAPVYDPARGKQFFNFQDFSRRRLLQCIEAECGLGIDTCKRILSAIEDRIAETATTQKEVFVASILCVRKMPGGGYQVTRRSYTGVS